jgi:hypothetical protein
VQRQHRARHLYESQADHRCAGDDAGDRARTREPFDLAEAGEAPHAARHAERRERRQVDRGHAEQDPAVVAGPRRQPALEAQAEQVGRVPREHDDHRVGCQRDRLAPAPQARE